MDQLPAYHFNKQKNNTGNLTKWESLKMKKCLFQRISEVLQVQQYVLRINSLICLIMMKTSMNIYNKFRKIWVLWFAAFVKMEATYSYSIWTFCSSPAWNHRYSVMVKIKNVKNVYKDVFEDRWTFTFCIRRKTFNHFDVPQHFIRVTDFFLYL